MTAPISTKERGLTEAQRAVLELWQSGSGSPRYKRMMTGKRMPFVAQCVAKQLLETASGLPFAGRKRACLTLIITSAGRRALSESEPGNG